MQFIGEIYQKARAAGRPVISFELFPPKTDDGERNLLHKTLPELLTLQPDFISVTYGAGGGTRDKSLRIVGALARDFRVTTLAHLTCVNATEPQIREILAEFQALGVRNILALRGDPPAQQGHFTPTPGGFEYASQLVQLLRQLGGFSIGAAAFPEGHIACQEGKLADWMHLKNKIAHGADFAITQLFFDNRHYFALRDFFQQQAITVPLVPGLIPILGAAQIQKFTALCGAEIPAPLQEQLQQVAHDDAAAIELGIEFATRQARELLAAGAPGIHFYCLNKAHSVRAILQRLELR